MTRTVTIRLPEEHYGRIKAAAEADNRPISNFIQTATLRFIEQSEFCDEAEMDEIMADAKLLKSLKAGSQDASKSRYSIVKGGVKGH
jgi:predicted DNA-binding protein